jgi:hypothetical protein
MTSILEGVRGTVHGVFGASRHLAWYVNWRTGAPEAMRESRPAPPGDPS